VLAKAENGDLEGALRAMRNRAAVEFDSMLGLDDEAMMDEFFRGGPPDERLDFLTDELRVQWARDLREALMTCDGYARDNLAWGMGWDIDLRDIRAPTAACIFEHWDEMFARLVEPWTAAD